MGDSMAESLPSDELLDDVLNNLDDSIVDIHSSTTSSSVSVRYFRDDPLIPIYSSNKERPVHSKSIAQEIVNGVETHLVSSLVPHQPSENISFMIGTQYIGHWKDVLADNLGTWRCDGTKSLYYVTEKNSSGTKLQPTIEKKANLLVTRYLYAYPQTTSFKRIVITVHGRVSVQSKWELKSPIFLQYYFTDGRKPIFVSPHGNSKKLKPYFRTKESVKTLKRKFGQRRKSPQPILESVNNTFFESSFQSVGPCVTSKKRKQQAMSCRPPTSYLNNIRKTIRVPEQPLVNVGCHLIKPPQPEPQHQPYELLIRKGNISVCHGCENPFLKENDIFILGRTEFDWYPKIENATKTFKLSGARNHYYCLKKRCLMLRRPHLADITIIHGGTTLVPDEIHTQIRNEFDTEIVQDWMY